MKPQSRMTLYERLDDYSPTAAVVLAWSIIIGVPAAFWVAVYLTIRK